MCRLLRRHDGPSQLDLGIYFRLLLIGYFEGIDSERGIAWRAADSFALRDFLGLALPEAPPDHSTVSRTRRLIDRETHEAVFTWMLQRACGRGPGEWPDCGRARGAREMLFTTGCEDRPGRTPIDSNAHHIRPIVVEPIR
jgi:transposase-like protein DUF772